MFKNKRTCYWKKPKPACSKRRCNSCWVHLHDSENKRDSWQLNLTQVSFHIEYPIYGKISIYKRHPAKPRSLGWFLKLSCSQTWLTSNLDRKCQRLNIPQYVKEASLCLHTRSDTNVTFSQQHRVGHARIGVYSLNSKRIARIRFSLKISDMVVVAQPLD